jgi:hypothetical protein
MDIRVNGKSFTSKFATESTFSASEGAVSLDKRNGALTISFPKLGKQLNIFVLNSFDLKLSLNKDVPLFCKKQYI